MPCWIYWRFAIRVFIERLAIRRAWRTAARGSGKGGVGAPGRGHPRAADSGRARARRPKPGNRPAEPAGEEREAIENLQPIVLRWAELNVDGPEARCPRPSPPPRPSHPPPRQGGPAGESYPFRRATSRIPYSFRRASPRSPGAYASVSQRRSQRRAVGELLSEACVDGRGLACMAARPACRPAGAGKEGRLTQGLRGGMWEVGCSS